MDAFRAKVKQSRNASIVLQQVILHFSENDNQNPNSKNDNDIITHIGISYFQMSNKNVSVTK